MIKFLLIVFLFTTQLFASGRGPTENVGGFLAGTLVHTSFGPVTIQNIRINDRVISYDTKESTFVNSRVTQTHQFDVDSLCHIKISGEKRVLYVNPDHRFYLPKSETWVAAKKLKAGSDQVMTRDNNLLTVESVRTVLGKETLYELTVEDTENYFIGKQKILVHNWAFVIPVITWTIGEGVAWASAATIAAAAAYGIAKNASDRICRNSSSDTRQDINLDRFSDRKPRRGQSTILRDPKSGEYLEPEKARNSGAGPHGGSHWKWKDKKGNRIGTINKDGKLIRK